MRHVLGLKPIHGMQATAHDDGNTIPGTVTNITEIGHDVDILNQSFTTPAVFTSLYGIICDV